MTLDIQTIATPFIFRVTVNYYLIRTEGGFPLIDTGRSARRREIAAVLERAARALGSVQLILLTHGDFDHCGNAAYLREKFDTTIAMHEDDGGMVEEGICSGIGTGPAP
jgi:hydroxyacylglutathione hydrolase